MTIELGISIECHDENTPKKPEAKRGDCFDGTIDSTREQLDAGLLWWPCGFCGTNVLISTRIKGREKCKCGAIRHNHFAEVYWKRGNEKAWYL